MADPALVTYGPTAGEYRSWEGRRMKIDLNSVVLAARVYAALREHFFIGTAPGTSAEAAGGEVLATIRDAIVNYVEEQIGA